MDSITYNDFDFDSTVFSSPNKRKQEERDDDVIVTPSSSYDNDSDSDDSTRDSESLYWTPCPTLYAGSSTKRRRRSTAEIGNLSPPPMPQLKYQSSKMAEERFHIFHRRSVLNIFEHDNDSSANTIGPDNDLSFLAIPTPPSDSSIEANGAKVPYFDLSPRTTLAPRIPEFFDSRRLNARDEKENKCSRRRPLPSLRMRPSNTRFGIRKLMGELTLPSPSEFRLSAV
jgi:hypothetical protein